MCKPNLRKPELFVFERQDITPGPPRTVYFKTSDNGSVVELRPSIFLIFRATGATLRMVHLVQMAPSARY